MQWAPELPLHCVVSFSGLDRCPGALSDTENRARGPAVRYPNDEEEVGPAAQAILGLETRLWTAAPDRGILDR